VTLGQYFGSRPVVLTFVYYDCPLLRSQVLALVRGLKSLRLDAGRDFDVLAISSAGYARTRLDRACPVSAGIRSCGRTWLSFPDRLGGIDTSGDIGGRISVQPGSGNRPIPPRGCCHRHDSRWATLTLPSGDRFRSARLTAADRRSGWRPDRVRSSTPSTASSLAIASSTSARAMLRR
jgi:hypothetical protein